MKGKIFILFLAALFMQNLFAQEQLSDSISVQEENQKWDTIPIEHNPKAVSYRLILEYGLSSGIERYYHKYSNFEEMETNFYGGLFLTAINNISFKDKFLLGIGGGLELRAGKLIVIPSEIGATCFLNFRYHFIKSEKRNLIPMLNIAIGSRMVVEHYFFDNEFSKMMYGVYSTLGAGFKIKRLSVQCGILFWTKGHNSYSVNIMAKAGLSF
jgi:hypothetical protein